MPKSWAAASSIAQIAGWDFSQMWQWDIPPKMEIFEWEKRMIFSAFRIAEFDFSAGIKKKNDDQWRMASLDNDLLWYIKWSGLILAHPHIFVPKSTAKNSFKDIFRHIVFTLKNSWMMSQPCRKHMAFVYLWFPAGLRGPLPVLNPKTLCLGQQFVSIGWATRRLVLLSNHPQLGSKNQELYQTIHTNVS